MPNGLPDSFEPVKQDDTKGLPDSFEPINEPVKTAPIIGLTKPPVTNQPYDASRDILANTLNPVAGFLGLPQIGDDPLKSYGVGELINTALPILGGAGAAYGAAKLGKKLLGAGRAVEDLSSLKTPISEAVQELSPAHAKLLTALEESKPLNAEQKAIYSAERSERLGKLKNVTTTGQAGAQEKLSQLSGTMKKVTREPLKLEQPDVDALYDQIANHPRSIGYNEVHAITGMQRLLDGQVPRPFEVDQLEKIFGPDIKRHIPVFRGQSLVNEAVNFPKSVMASMDFSAPLRQGLGMIHRKEYWTSFDDMFKSFGSEKAFKGVQQSIEASPYFPLMQESGLHLTDLGSMSTREEAFMSNWAESGKPLGYIHPALQKGYANTMGRAVRASDRAYTGFLNKLRADSFSALIESAKLQGLEPEKNLYLTKELANYVNNATGRGSLGRLEKSAVALNDVFFSPRLIASRVNMLNPMTYANASPMVRKEYLKSLFAIAGTGVGVAALGKLAGGEVENDPESTDFGKVKFGNTRLDPYGGFQQYIVPAVNLITNKKVSTYSGHEYELGSRYGLSTKGDILFGKRGTLPNKFAPVPKFAWDWLFANKADKPPFNAKTELGSMVVPMIIQDTYDVAKENPRLLPITIPVGTFGMGVQTYGK